MFEQPHLPETTVPETVALDFAIAIQAADGAGVETAVDEALLARLATLLNRPGLQRADLTSENIPSALSAALAELDICLHLLDR